MEVFTNNKIIIITGITIIVILLVSIIIIIWYIYNQKLHKLHTMIIDNNSSTDYKRNCNMNGISMQYYISFSHHYNLFKLTKIITTILDDNNIDYFLIGGSLIGYHRHNKSFIPWDDDIDIGVFEKDKNRLTALLTAYCDENKDYTINIIFDIYKFRFNKDIFIDIFYYKYDNKLQHYNYYTKTLQDLFPQQYIKIDEIYPLNIIDFILYLPDGEIYEKIKIKTLNNSIDYLDRIYPNWQHNKIVSIPHNSYYKLLFNK